MPSKIVSDIRKRSREDWKQDFFETITEIRIWIQEHGERSAIIALFAGIFVVLFPMLVVYIILGCVIVCSAIYFIALPTSQLESSSNASTTDPSVNGHPHADASTPDGKKDTSV